GNFAAGLREEVFTSALAYSDDEDGDSGATLAAATAQQQSFTLSQPTITSADQQQSFTLSQPTITSAEKTTVLPPPWSPDGAGQNRSSPTRQSDDQTSVVPHAIRRPTAGLLDDWDGERSAAAEGVFVG